MPIRPCLPEDSDAILAVVNDAARAYRGLIPADHWSEPYMSPEYLQGEIDAGVRFFAFEQDGEIVGVMGIQDVAEVTLIRHAYVRTAAQRRGIATELYQHLRKHAHRPMLVGTWRAAKWAVSFYKRIGFMYVGRAETLRLLRTYWDIPDWQVAKSVVLADQLAWWVIVDRRAQ
jgi:GNAT superfamily N-acetyltransferase